LPNTDKVVFNESHWTTTQIVDHFLINLFPGKKIELFGIRIYHTTVKKSELQAKIGRKLKITKNNN
jgi:hypothetical protein